MSLPVVGSARGGSGSSSRPNSRGGETIETTLTRLETENSLLRDDITKEKAKFGRTFIRDMKHPARRRIEPMKKLLFEQSQVTSQLSAKANVKQSQLDLVMHRAVNDNKVQALRTQDVVQMQGNLEYLEDQLAEAAADAEEACDREDTYSMMEQRLKSLVDDDQAKINQVQKVINEAVMRLGQWHAVSKEGEAELASAEAELAALKAKLQEERAKQRKMIGERKTMVESMTQYTNERNQRMQAHKDRLLAQRGDLSEEGEDKLRTAAGTIDAVRVINEAAAKSTLTFEEKCKEAFQQIEGLTGATSIAEVLQIVTSKKELTGQLQRRVDSVQERIQTLNEERGGAEDELTEVSRESRTQQQQQQQHAHNTPRALLLFSPSTPNAFLLVLSSHTPPSALSIQTRAQVMYGSAEDSEAKLQLEQTRPLVDISAEKLSEASKRFGETLRNLQGCRLAWENILHMLEGAAERGPASGKSRVMSRINESQVTEGSTVGGDDDEEMFDAVTAASKGSGGLLPKEVTEMPMMIEEVQNR